MNSPVGAYYKVCREFGYGFRVLAKPGCLFQCPLRRGGHGSLGCNISCRVPAHSVCHEPDAAIVQEGQRVLV